MTHPVPPFVFNGRAVVGVTGDDFKQCLDCFLCAVAMTEQENGTAPPDVDVERLTDDQVAENVREVLRGVEADYYSRVVYADTACGLGCDDCGKAMGA